MQYNFGNALYMTGKTPRSCAAYRQAIQLKRDYVEAHTNLGSLLISLGDLRTAIAELQESIRLRASNPVAHNNLGYAYVKLGETLDRAAANQYLQQAVAAYKEALRLKPDYVKAQNNLGAAYNKLNQYQEALRSFNARRARSPIFRKLTTTSARRSTIVDSSKKQWLNFNRLFDSGAITRTLTTASARRFMDQQFELKDDAYKKALALKPANAETNNNSALSISEPNVTTKQRPL